MQLMEHPYPTSIPKSSPRWVETAVILLLLIPDQYTEDQFFEAGRLLARIEHGMQWAIGDWYNAIPWGDKAACEEVGLNPKTAMQYGWVASKYQISMRIENLKFDHHRVLAIEELDDEQRASLLRRAEWGELKKDGTRRPWTTAELVQERDTILGRERVPLPDFDEKVDQTVDSLPANASQKIRTAVYHLLDSLKTRFQREIEAEVKKRMAAKHSESLEDEKELIR